MEESSTWQNDKKVEKTETAVFFWGRQGIPKLKLSRIQKVMEVAKKKEVGRFRCMHAREFIVVYTYAVPEGETQPEKSKDGYLCVINRPIGEYEFWKSKIGDWLEFDKEKRMYKTVNLLEKNRKKES